MKLLNMFSGVRLYEVIVIGWDLPLFVLVCLEEPLKCIIVIWCPLLKDSSLTFYGLRFLHKVWKYYNFCFQKFTGSYFA